MALAELLLQLLATSTNPESLLELAGLELTWLAAVPAVRFVVVVEDELWLVDTPELTMETIEEGLALAGTALGFPQALQDFDINQFIFSKICYRCSRN